MTLRIELISLFLFASGFFSSGCKTSQKYDQAATKDIEIFSNHSVVSIDQTRAQLHQSAQTLIEYGLIYKILMMGLDGTVSGNDVHPYDYLSGFHPSPDRCEDYIHSRGIPLDDPAYGPGRNQSIWLDAISGIYRFAPNKDCSVLANSLLSDVGLRQHRITFDWFTDFCRDYLTWVSWPWSETYGKLICSQNVLSEIKHFSCDQIAEDGSVSIGGELLHISENSPAAICCENAAQKIQFEGLNACPASGPSLYLYTIEAFKNSSFTQSASVLKKRLDGNRLSKGGLNTANWVWKSISGNDSFKYDDAWNKSRDDVHTAWNCPYPCGATFYGSEAIHLFDVVRINWKSPVLQTTQDQSAQVNEAFYKSVMPKAFTTIDRDGERILHESTVQGTTDHWADFVVEIKPLKGTLLLAPVDRAKYIVEKENPGPVRLNLKLLEIELQRKQEGIAFKKSSDQPLELNSVARYPFYDNTFMLAFSWDRKTNQLTAIDPITEEVLTHDASTLPLLVNVLKWQPEN